MNRQKTLLLISLCLGFAQLSLGQLFSPYSQYGLGIVNNNLSPALSAMGGIGVAYADKTNINYVNPAALAEVNLTTFDIGVRLNTRSISNSQNTALSVAGGGVNNISLSFPIIKRTWGMSIGLLPYSFSKYKFSTTKSFDGQDYTASTEGKGSLYKLYWANGVQWKGIRFGINTEFIFGKLENNLTTVFTDDAGSTGSRLTRAMSLRDVVLTLGAQYTANLTKFEDREDDKEDLELTVGAIFAPGLKVDAYASKYLEGTKISSISGNSFSIDTAAGSFFKQYSTTAVPTHIGAGVNIGRKNRWELGLDYDYKSWLKFKSPISNQKLTDEWQIKLGAQITPNYKSKKYFSRINYRLGTHFGKAPIIHENTGVSDFGITFGFGLPLSRYKFLDRSLSNLNFAFEIGALGLNKKQNLVENYYNFTLSYSLSALWFRKNKFE